MTKLPHDALVFIGDDRAKRRGARHPLPPKTLADLRKTFDADVKAKIVAEADKDLTKHPVSEIESYLLGRSGRHTRDH